MSAKIVCTACGADVPDRAIHVFKDRFGKARGIKVHCKCGNAYTKAPPRCRECNQFPGAHQPYCSHNKNRRHLV